MRLKEIKCPVFSALGTCVEVIHQFNGLVSLLTWFSENGNFGSIEHSWS